MAVFDNRLVAPTEAELVEALRKAMKAANRENRYHTNRMTRDAAFWGRFAQDVLRSGPEGRRRSCKGGRAVPEVVAGWWTDPAARKHVRVIGRTRVAYSQLRGEVELRSLPPWWHVYPEAVLGVRGKKEGERYLAVCRCGAVGSPETLGWMGDTCGPCFDRRAEGGTASGGFGQFAGWSPGLSRFCFSADGRHLVGQNVGNFFCRVRREDGAATASARKSYNYAIATAASAAGTTLVMQDGSVYRWAEGADDIHPLIAHRRPFWGRAALAPDGSRVTLLGYQQAYTADLAAGRPRYAPCDTPEGLYAVQYAPDGSRLLGVTFNGELRAVDPQTMRADTIRADTFDGLPGGYGPPLDMAQARDGSSVLLSRQRSYPYRVTVRHVPLRPGAGLVTLDLPDWHRPTTLAYSPDGRHAVTAESEGGWVGFFSVASGKCLGFVRAVLEGNAWRSGQIEFSADGRALAVSYSVGHFAHGHGSTVAVWPWPDALQAAGVG
jgi:hypothetical protein